MVCAVLVLLEAAAHVGIQSASIGEIPFTPLAVVAALVLTVTTWNKTAPPPPATWVFIIAALPAAMMSITYAGVASSTGLLFVAFGEEAVFRVAVPLLVLAIINKATGTTRWTRWSPLVAVSFSAVVFAVMPGHVAQWGTSPTGPAPWVALSILWAGMLLRGLPLVAVIVHHALVDFAALSVTHGAPAVTWTAFLVLPVATGIVLEFRRDRRQAIPATA